VLNNICYDIKIEHQDNVKICYILITDFFTRNLVRVCFITTCRGRGHFVAALLQPHCFLLLLFTQHTFIGLWDPKAGLKHTCK